MNLTALLSAIAIIESSDAHHPQGNDLARGRKGEVSRYQIMPATWKRFGGGALVNARDHIKARAVAMKIVRSFDTDFWAEGNQVVACAIQWNKGLQTHAKLGRKMDRIYPDSNRYPMRVWNEYQVITSGNRRVK